MTDKQPLFSVIIPVYNVRSYLPECLDSLLRQTYSNFQVIVVDDVSTDGSRDIARSYAEKHPEKIQLIEHMRNTRQGGARNTGIAAASGDFLMFLDSDDYLEPNTLEVLVETFAREEDADIVEFCFSFVNEYGTYLRRSFFKNRIERLGVYKPLLISEMGPCNKAYRASLFQETEIRFPEKYYYEDYWTVPKVLMAAEKVIYLDEALYCYRQHSASTMHDTNVERNNDIMLGTDELLRFSNASGFSEDDTAALESLATEHVLLNATLRVNTIDLSSEMQHRIKTYMEKNFPNYRNNPYLYRFSRREKMLLRLIVNEQYALLNLMWYRRNQLSGKVKGILRKFIKI